MSKTSKIWHPGSQALASERVWDPERKRYVAVSGERSVGTSSVGRVVPRYQASDLAWLGAPMSDAEAAAYETKRAAILKAAE